MNFIVSKILDVIANKGTVADLDIVLAKQPLTVVDGITARKMYNIRPQKYFPAKLGGLIPRDYYSGKQLSKQDMKFTPFRIAIVAMRVARYCRSIRSKMSLNICRAKILRPPPTKMAKLFMSGPALPPSRAAPTTPTQSDTTATSSPPDIVSKKSERRLLTPSLSGC